MNLFANIIANSRLRCKHCGGHLLKEDGEYGEKSLGCFLCGREHTMNGELIKHRIGVGNTKPKSLK